MKEDILKWGKLNRRKLKNEQNISLIFPGLYQGNFSGAKDIEYLNLIGINTILNCGAYNYKTDLIYKKVELEDSSEADLLKILPECTNFIEKELSIENKIFIHCKGGYSRSPSIVIAYLIKFKKFTYEEAYNFMKKRRPSIKPNDGFILQLKNFEKLV
jgi:hypothetical protein